MKEFIFKKLKTIGWLFAIVGLWFNVLIIAAFLAIILSPYYTENYFLSWLFRTILIFPFIYVVLRATVWIWINKIWITFDFNLEPSDFYFDYLTKYKTDKYFLKKI